MSAQERAYLSSSLDAVSRSFALVIPMLEAPLDAYVGVAYLLCRVCDNIEDCTHPYDWKRARFAEFRELLRDPGEAPRVLASWGAWTWQGLSAKEQAMMGPDGATLWDLFARIPAEDAAIIAHWAGQMATGMERLLAPVPNDAFLCWESLRVLRGPDDLDDYCFYVAGTVGHMCTELVLRRYPLTDAAADILDYHCEAFGRALQKTNIFKDFMVDLRRGVSYLPYAWMDAAALRPLRGQGAPHAWIDEVLSHIWGELDRAVDYVAALPYEATGYRQFCLRAILPAYETLLLAARQREVLFTPAHQVKISREQMASCLQRAAALDRDNVALLEYRRELAMQRRQRLEHARTPSALLSVKANSIHVPGSVR